MEDVHLAKAQATFQNVLQQRRPHKAFIATGDHVDHQYFFNRRQFLGAFFGRACRFAYHLIINWVEQCRNWFILAQIQVALLRLTAATTIQFTGA